MRVIDAMKAKAPDSQALANISGERVLTRVLRQGRMKGRIEDNHMRNIGQQFPRLTDCRDSRRVVHRGQHAEPLELVQHAIIEQCRRVKSFPAMNHTMRNGLRGRRLALIFTQQMRYSISHTV